MCVSYPSKASFFHTNTHRHQPLTRPNTHRTFKGAIPRYKRSTPTQTPSDDRLHIHTIPPTHRYQEREREREQPRKKNHRRVSSREAKSQQSNHPQQHRSNREGSMRDPENGPSQPTRKTPPPRASPTASPSPTPSPSRCALSEPAATGGRQPQARSHCRPRTTRPAPHATRTKNGAGEKNLKRQDGAPKNSLASSHCPPRRASAPESRPAPGPRGRRSRR